jgi:hypothetical protein
VKKSNPISITCPPSLLLYSVSIFTSYRSSIWIASPYSHVQYILRVTCNPSVVTNAFTSLHPPTNPWLLSSTRPSGCPLILSVCLSTFLHYIFSFSRHVTLTNWRSFVEAFYSPCSIHFDSEAERAHMWHVRPPAHVWLWRQPFSYDRGRRSDTSNFSYLTNWCRLNDFRKLTADMYIRPQVHQVLEGACKKGISETCRYVRCLQLWFRSFW